MEVTPKEMRKAWKDSQLSVSQNDGVTRTAKGEIVGKQKWVVNVDYSLDSKEAEDFIVNAISQQDAEERTRELLLGVARRKGMELGSVFTNYVSTEAEIKNG